MFYNTELKLFWVIGENKKFLGKACSKSIFKRKFFLNELFTPKLILLRSLNMFFQWFSVTMVYYGLLFASTSLSGNSYQNFTLVVLAELPSILMYLKLPHWFGRRNVLIASQIIMGICCIIGGLLTQVLKSRCIK